MQLFMANWRHTPPGEFSRDAYSLFYARSAAMGWLTPAVEGDSGGLWGMNDAEAGPGSGTQRQPVSFFQVVVTRPAPDGVLPVQPFLSCAGDVMARRGSPSTFTHRLIRRRQPGITGAQDA
jgi:hypothetical protein